MDSTVAPHRADRATDSASRRLDRAIDRLLAFGSTAAPPGVEPRLMDAAARVRLGLPLVAPGPLFEARVAELLRALHPPGGWHDVFTARSRHRRLIAGAISSAAVSVAGLTAVAVWRAAHRQS